MPISNLREKRFQSKLSEMYLEIVIHQAGCNKTSPKPEEDVGIDYHLRLPTQKDRIGRPVLDIQLKSVREHKLRGKGDQIVYDCPAQNYNDLISTDDTIPRILVLVIMPTDLDTWVSITEEELAMKLKAYYLSLRGEKESKNSDSQKVDIPKKNIFNVDTLKQIIAKGHNQ